MADIIAACQAAGYDLVILETPGIGQGDAAVLEHADVSLYVMTPEFGAASQLEKIDMLDFADVVAINKFERRGGADALRDVSRQLIRNRGAFGARPEDMPVFGTSAATFNDTGVTALYQHLAALLKDRGLPLAEGLLPAVAGRESTDAASVIPPARAGYLAEIAATVRGYHQQTQEQAAAVRRVQRLAAVRAELDGDSERVVANLAAQAARTVAEDSQALITSWPEVVRAYSGDEQVVRVRDRELRTGLTRQSLSGSTIPRVALPRYEDHGELLRFLREENLPGYFPFTAGVFPFKREGEDPARMFAGEGDPFRTNRRFQLLSAGSAATRLSTAFDSVTLYGRDPGESPDVYGKVGTSGVSIATLEDMKALYDGFDLGSPTTSVSMTINGPAPTILAFFLNTAIDQAVTTFRSENDREPTAAEAAELRGRVLATVRGTVQADILKEDQGQNTCIFSTEFSLADDGRHPGVVHRPPGPQLLLGIDLRLPHRRGGREPDQPAGVHPGQRVHLRRGLPRQGNARRRLRAEPLVLLLQRHGSRVHGDRPGRPPHLGRRDAGPVRRERAVAEAEVPRADLRPVAARAGDGVQRHPHHAAGAVRDLRQRNSLHTNAYDEAVTTPSEESVRRALAIQLIINREWGLAANENPLQGSFIVDELTDLVEEAVLRRVRARSPTAAACSARWRPATSAARSRTSRCSTSSASTTAPCRSSASTPSATRRPASSARRLELARGTEEEKQSQLDRVRDFQERHRQEAHAALAALQGRRPRRPERVRRADGRRPGLLACGRSPRRSSKSAASTGATCERTRRGTAR